MENTVSTAIYIAITHNNMTGNLVIQIVILEK